MPGPVGGRGDDADLVVGQNSREFVPGHEGFIAAGDQGRTLIEGHGNFGDGGIERRRSELQDIAFGRNLEKLALGFGQIDQPAVLDHHPFGLTRRARGVDDISGLVGRGPLFGVDGGIADEFLGVVNEKGITLERKLPIRGRDHIGDTGILDHVGEALLGIIGIDGEVSPTGLMDAENRRRQVGAAFETDADQGFGFDPHGDEGIGNAVGAAVELAVGHFLAVVLDGHGIGCFVDLLFKNLMQQFAVGEVRPGIVETADNQIVLPGVEKGNIADGLIGIARHHLHHVVEMPGHPFHSFPFEKVAIVFQVTGQGLAVGPEVEGQVEFGNLEFREEQGCFELWQMNLVKGFVSQGEHGLEDG